MLRTPSLSADSGKATIIRVSDDQRFLFEVPVQFTPSGWLKHYSRGFLHRREQRQILGKLGRKSRIASLVHFVLVPSDHALER